MERERLIRNAAIMTGISLALRLAGVWYRASQTAAMGAEGVGLHQLLLSPFLFAVTLSTAGLSTGVTRLLSEDMGRGRTESGVLRAALTYGCVLSLTAAVLLFTLARPIGELLLGDGRTVFSLRILAFCLPFMGASACFRGYFVARREAFLPSAGDLLEQGAEMAVFFLLMPRMREADAAWRCAAVTLGTLVSEIVSCLFLWSFCRRRGGSLQGRAGDAAPRLLPIAVPVSLSACLGAGLRMTENVLIPRMLRVYGLTAASALTVFGQVRGMALPMIFLPAAFLSACSLLMVPEIAQARVSGGSGACNPAIRRVLQFTFLLSILVAALCVVYGQALGQAVYHTAEVGAFLRILAPLVPLMYLDTIVDGMLKGLNQQLTVLKYNLIDSVLRIGLLLLWIPRYGTAGFLAMMVVSNVFNPVLSVRRILRCTGIRPDWKNWLWRPLLAAVAASGLCLLLRSRMTGVIGLILGVLLLICGYILGLGLTGALGKPGGITILEGEKTGAA